jgi:chromosomal replication initiation ATPase DnaA
MSEADLAEVWARSLDGLADMQLEPHQRAWLNLTRPLGVVENTALIATPNEFVKEQLETRLRTIVTHALSRELGRSIQLAVTVDPAAAFVASADSADRSGQTASEAGAGQHGGRDESGLPQPAGSPDTTASGGVPAAHHSAAGPPAADSVHLVPCRVRRRAAFPTPRQARPRPRIRTQTTTARRSCRPTAGERTPGRPRRG